MGDFWKCQTFAASPAEPGDLPWWVSLGKRRLRLDRTLNGIDAAAELCQYAVPGSIGNPTATGGNQAVKDVSSLGQILESTDLVGPHQAAVSLDVGCKNRDQPAFGISRFGQDAPSDGAN